MSMFMALRNHCLFGGRLIKKEENICSVMQKRRPSLNSVEHSDAAREKAVYTRVKDDARRQQYTGESSWTAHGCRLAGSRRPDSYAES